MRIIVNGAEHEAEEGASVAGVVALATGRGDGPATGVAVALNDQVVPRGAWDTTIVREADRVEVLTAVQGG